MNKKLAQRFNELEVQLSRVQATKNTSHSSTGQYENVDANLMLEWNIKAKNLIIKVCGEDSQHFKAFLRVEIKKSFLGSYSTYESIRAVFLATKEDFEGGYLSSYKSLVQAEVFETELEQASELLKNGYHVASAVIAGVVLETTLRELCNRERISIGNINKMNADLAKAGIYNSLVQKQITAHAAVRNSAAHGNNSEFSRKDVEQMIPAIEQFLALYLSEN